MAAEQKDAVEAFRDFNLLKGRRGNFESHWKEIAERILPIHSKIFQSQASLQTAGEKRTEHLFDSTAAIALNRFGSILDSLLTPSNQTWHKLRSTIPELNKIKRVNVFFDELTRILFKHRYAPEANFSSQNQQNFISLGAYGTGAMFVDQLSNGKGLRYKNVHLNEVFLRENHQGIVDSAYRYFGMPARNILQQWPDSTPERVRKSIERDPDQNFFVLHCVRPRENFDPNALDSLNMPWQSLYVIEEGKLVLEESGYRVFPYPVSRYTQVPGEVYGRGPAMDVLPAIKTLNEEKKTILKQGHRVVDPVLLAHDDGVLDSFSLRPGAVNYGGVNAQGKALVHTLPTGNLAIGKDLMDDERAVINDAFLVSLFQILVETPTMTATEVIERAREKGILVAPTLGRIQSEYLGPTITREIDVITAIGLMPEIPPEILESASGFEVVYDSPLSRAQRAEEASGIMRSFQATAEIVAVTQDPAPFDHFDFDQIVPDFADIQGVPAKWIRSSEAIQVIREQRAVAQKKEEANRAAPGMAALIKSGATAAKAVA